MMSVKPIPDGFHSVTPYLTVQGVDRLLVFLAEAFGGKVIEKMQGPDGSVMHAEVKIGDSIIMLGEARGEWKPMPTGLYLYVENADATYKKALAAGATSVSEPADQFYGDRHGGVKDPSGNLWWIATHIEDVSKEEMQRRAQEWMAKARA